MIQRRPQVKTHDLTDYINHAERYGPECVLETAVFELPRQDAAKLRAFIESKQRVFEFKRGQWSSAAGAPCGHVLIAVAICPPGRRRRRSITNIAEVPLRADVGRLGRPQEAAGRA